MLSTTISNQIGEISYLDIKVGKILEVAPHPTDENLYVSWYVIHFCTIIIKMLEGSKDCNIS